MENTTTNSTEGPTDQSEYTWTWAPVPWEWWEILHLILAVVGILGNFLVMIVLLRPRHRRCATDTLIGALAVADFLTSIFIITVIPHERVKTLPDTPGGQFYCRIIHSSVLMWISICASIFTLTTISVERLAAVRYPFLHQRLFSPTRLPILIVVLWILSFIINTFSLYVHFVEGGVCVTRFPSPEFQAFIGASLFIVEYVVPIIIMITAHLMTLYSLRQRGQSSTADDGKKAMSPKLKAAQRRVLQMLLIVVITFIICWTPDQFGFLVFNLGVVDFTHLFSPLYRCLVILAFVNSCANPFIYAIRSPGFREALMCGRMGRRYGTHSIFADLSSSVHSTTLGEMNTTEKI